MHKCLQYRYNAFIYFNLYLDVYLWMCVCVCLRVLNKECLRACVHAFSIVYMQTFCVCASTKQCVPACIGTCANERMQACVRFTEHYSIVRLRKTILSTPTYYLCFSTTLISVGL